MRLSIRLTTRQLGCLSLLAGFLLACASAPQRQVQPGPKRPAATAEVERLPQSGPGVRHVARAQVFRSGAGVRFALLSEPATNLVRIDVRYATGATFDPKGRAGLAHLVEHLTYRLRTGANQPTLADRLSRDALSFNAYTRWDETHFYATALADKWQSLVEAELDRQAIGCAGLSEADLARERRVVARELESRGDRDGLQARLRRAAFPAGHRYHRDVGGDRQQLARVRLADACTFMREQLHPSRMIVVISGRIDTDAVRARLEARHGKLTPWSPPAGVRPDPIASPPTTAFTDVTADVSSPILVLLIPEPAWGTVSSARHSIAVSLIVERLRERVRKDETVAGVGAIHVGGWAQGFRGLYIQVNDSDALPHAVRLMRDTGNDPFFGQVAADVTAAVVRRYRASLLRATENFGTRAMTLADALQYADARGIDRMLDTASAIEHDELASFLRGAFARATWVRITPAEKVANDPDADAPESRTSTGLSQPERHADDHPGDAVHGAVTPAQRAHDPVLAQAQRAEAERALDLPKLPSYPPAEQRVLDNGLRVLLLRRAGAHTVHVHLSFATGEQAGPRARSLAEFAAALRQPALSAPWSHHLADDLARADHLPVAIEAAVEPDATVFRGSAPANHGRALLWNLHLYTRFGGYFALSDVGKILWRRRLDAVAEERSRSMTGMVDAILASDGSAARERAAIRSTISSLQRRELDEHAARHYRPERGLLIVAGEFEPTAVMHTIQDLFASWQPARAAQTDAATDAPATAAGAAFGQRVLVPDKSGQPARVLVVFPGLASATDSASTAAAALIRTMLEIHLARDLRETATATYHVDVSLRDGALVIDTELGEREAVRALSMLHSVADRLLSEHFLADFVLARKQTAERTLARAMSTGSLIASISRRYRAGTSGPLADPLVELGRAVAKLGPDEIRALIKTRLGPDRASLLIRTDRERGMSLFAAIGAPAPRIAE